MDIKELNAKMDQLTVKGEIIEAVETFFDDTIKTTDHASGKTTSKTEKVEFLKGFLGSIAQVNEITHHGTTVNENTTASEYTFDFDMQDGSKIHWHEIILRKWNNGKVVEETYFVTNN